MSNQGPRFKVGDIVTTAVGMEGGLLSYNHFYRIERVSAPGYAVKSNISNCVYFFEEFRFKPEVYKLSKLQELLFLK